MPPQQVAHNNGLIRESSDFFSCFSVATIVTYNTFALTAHGICTAPFRDAHRKRCRRSLCCSVFRRAANFSSKLSMDILLFSQRLSKLRAWLTVFTSTTQHHRHIAMKRQYTHLPTARKMLQESNPHKEQHQEIHDKVTRFSSTPLQKRSKSRHHLSSQKPIAGRGQISELKHSTQQHKSYL